MNFRQLQMLQAAAPILLRHLGAYAELATQDIAFAKERFIERAKVGILFLISGHFALLAICVFVVAAAWDTRYRLIAIGMLGGIFIVVTVVAGALIARTKPVSAFESVRREWRQDRLILERLLGDQQEASTDGTHAQSVAPSQSQRLDRGESRH